MTRPSGGPHDDSGPSSDEIYDFAEPEEQTPKAPPPRPQSPRAAEQDSTFRPNPAPRPRRPTRPEPVSESGVDDDDTPDEDETDFDEKTSRKARPRASESALEGDRRFSSYFKKLGEVHLMGSVDPGEIARFSRQLGVYLDSGLPITRALTSLRSQLEGTAMAPVVDRFLVGVKAGQPLSDVAAKERQAFDPLYISMLRVAEARGGIPETLKSLASLYESRQRNARQIRSALIYPSAVILLALVVAGLLTFFVLPPMVGLLEDVVRGKAIELPLPTRILMGISYFVKDYGWWLLPLGGIGLAIFLPRYYRTDAGKRLLDPWILRIPVMGKLVSTIETARMSRTLGDLLDAGVPPDPSLQLTEEVMQFTPFRDAVSSVRDEVNQGGEFARAVRDTGRFDAEVIAFMETGEETGTLPEGLKKISREYEERADAMIKNLGSLLQPLFFLIIGSIVGFIAIAFIMAYVAILTSLMAA